MEKLTIKDEVKNLPQIRVMEDTELRDIEFLVGPDKTSMNAHKLMLALASPVFKAMFFGELVETVNPLILNDDCPETFQILLNYVYSGEVNFESNEEAINTYIAANKYLIMDLVEISKKHLIDKFDPNYGLNVYDVFTAHGETAAVEEVVEKCRKHASMIFQSESFCQASIDSLIKLFEQEPLNIDGEIMLIDALHKYTIANKSYKYDNEHPKVRQALSKIRFLTLKPKEVVESVGIRCLLTPMEIVGVLSNIISNVSGVALNKDFSTSNVHRIIGCKLIQVKRSICCMDLERFVEKNSSSQTMIAYPGKFILRGVVLATVYDYHDQNDSDFDILITTKLLKVETLMRINNVTLGRREKIFYFPNPINCQAVTLQVTFLKSAKLFGKYVNKSSDFDGFEFLEIPENDFIHCILKGIVVQPAS